MKTETIFLHVDYFGKANTSIVHRRKRSAGGSEVILDVDGRNERKITPPHGLLLPAAKVSSPPSLPRCGGGGGLRVVVGRGDSGLYDAGIRLCFGAETFLTVVLLYLEIKPVSRSAGTHGYTRRAGRRTSRRVTPTTRWRRAYLFQL